MKECAWRRWRGVVTRKREEGHLVVGTAAVELAVDCRYVDTGYSGAAGMCVPMCLCAYYLLSCLPLKSKL